MTNKQIERENQFAKENGYPSIQELWLKLNDHENYTQQTVKASEFFISPKQLLEAMQERLSKE